MRVSVRLSVFARLEQASAHCLDEPERESGNRHEAAQRQSRVSRNLLPAEAQCHRRQQPDQRCTQKNERKRGPTQPAADGSQQFRIPAAEPFSPAQQVIAPANKEKRQKSTGTAYYPFQQI